MLVKFDSVPSTVSNVYVVCYDDADSPKPFVVKYGFNISKVKVANKYPNPTEYASFNIPFIDLSLIPNTSIAQYRMRALFSRPI
jgi:hypothetical protein